MAGILAIVLALVGLSATTIQAGPAASTAVAAPTPGALQRYLVRLHEPRLLLRADVPSGNIVAEARAGVRAEVEAELARLVSARLAGAGYQFDEGAFAFQVDLSDSGREELARNANVASVEPAPAGTRLAPQAGPSGGTGPLAEVSSSSFIQVFSPFMWGRTSIGGLTVTLTLLDNGGGLRGVPISTTNTCTVAPNCVRINANPLYYETVFVDPTTRTTPVMILPGNQVQVVTSGMDPVQYQVVTKTIGVDDLRAWTSYEQDRVSGQATDASGNPVAGRPVIVTHVTTLSQANYDLTTTVTQTTTSADGSFMVGFTGSLKNLKQGSTGFVRLQHPGGDEVYTVHGQNVLVLENSSQLHGYAFPLLTAPVPLDPGVAVSPRPATTVAVTRTPRGGSPETAIVGSAPWISAYSASFGGGPIADGDTIDVSINGGPANRVVLSGLTARADLGTSQVVGTGPAGTALVLGVGKLRGYLGPNSRVDLLEYRFTTGSDGGYTAGPVQCGTANTLRLAPGSFGYVGYENARGNFVYTDFAAPVHQVMVDYPFLEGWIADGLKVPTVTLTGAGGSTKQAATLVNPTMLWADTDRLFFNVYYYLTPSQYIVPGDTVTVTTGGQSYTIPVDSVTAFVNTDTDAVVGQAPAGAAVRAVPSAGTRAARREVTADANGNYVAGNPFTLVNDSTCVESTADQQFNPGASGRVYVRHADGNEVFAVFGRSLHIDENDNVVDIYPFVLNDLDLLDPSPGTPKRTVTVTLTPALGSPVIGVCRPTDVPSCNSGGHSGHVLVRLTDGAGQDVNIRAGDTVSAVFEEGPPGQTRPATLTLTGLPLVTASPDLEANTVSGLGPQGWGGESVLSTDGTAKAAPIAPSAYTAYSPVGFVTKAQPGKPITLTTTSAGTVSFSDSAGHRIWTAWAVTPNAVKINGFLRPGDTQVCGKAPQNTTVEIHDMTAQGQDELLVTTTADGQGNFCATVPALVKGRVIVAKAVGSFGSSLSQPKIVGGAFQVYVPAMLRY